MKLLTHMNFIKTVTFTLLLTSFFTNAQVGIGTSNPENSSALQIDSSVATLVPPRMTDTEMKAIVNPLNGSIIYNTNFKSIYVYENNVWQSYGIKNKAIILNADFAAGNGNLNTSDNNYYNFPVGTSQILSTDDTNYIVESNGKIKILTEGTYLFSASLSSNNFPSGSKKYILAVFKNNNLISYLSRGTSTQNTVDYWGTSGTILYKIAANDSIEFKYVINNAGVAIDAKLVNIGITKMN